MIILAEAEGLPMPCRDTLFVWFFTWSSKCIWLPERLPLDAQKTLQPLEDDTSFCEYNCEFCEVPKPKAVLNNVRSSTTGEQND